MDYFNTYVELIDSDPDIAILPVGSIEQHTHHLPFATDSIIAYYMSKKISTALEEEGFSNYLLPPQPFATSLEHKGFKGTVTLKPPTLNTVVKDIVYCLYDHGFRYVVLYNCHGGNFILKPAVRELNYDNPSNKVILMQNWDLVPQKEVEEIFDTPDLHSGESETSVMLALCEGHVRDDMKDFVPDAPRTALDMYSFKHFTPEGVWGEPSKATKEKGERYVKLQVKNAVACITDWLTQCDENCEY